MEVNKMKGYIKDVLGNMPSDWLNLTTHRLDIYNEERAKVQFLDQFEILAQTDNSDTLALHNLPTAYDYIRLGHPLSCVLEWAIGILNNLAPEQVICFLSKTMPILSILRTNLLVNKNTLIAYTGDLPSSFDAEVLRTVYGYTFKLQQVENASEIEAFDGSTIFVSEQENIAAVDLNATIDFYVNLYSDLGSVLLVNGNQNKKYVSAIQHVRRRETVAMTPNNCFAALQSLVKQSSTYTQKSNSAENKAAVLDLIREVSGANTTPLVASSGLSIQYAIMMGLVHHALENHMGKAIKIVVPPNCYGGTNDQARRVAACNDAIEIVDLPVDGDNDMVQSIAIVLDKIAKVDAVPFIIAEIPTNPRVEVPELDKLRAVLSAKRKTASGSEAIDPVFILDQTFCPNVHFLGDADILSSVRTISFASGSKFPSGGKCTAGYCIANKKAEALIDKIDLHLKLCDNEATDLQYKILVKQMPSMNERIHKAFLNTHDFVSFIKQTLPAAKINFVSDELGKEGFTPSVFSLDLPTKDGTAEEREKYKREMNHRLINLMITEIPNESKYCVSYGQLHGCYWTIPATSTQGTTKEDDKDYIVRVSLSPDLDLEQHKKVFKKFVDSM
ncbi:PLP-dependent aminotransferase family protein [Maribacter hydrothermalis]|uniref:Cystathionine beta-synthase n=1 Tax=Maribacter hydrothermalis TaxID=1836467 RepID=A0A1B7Z8L3_9FLAO|nr:cystathionine beta-synthase [Maribacter hydrothermalis]APQ18952.1 cystathionine beta-synthase [Maribacter hydrothermalis]OBR39035.1 cystathionine beta-synthase [Maribacter hydrothermalis]